MSARPYAGSVRVLVIRTIAVGRHGRRVPAGITAIEGVPSVPRSPAVGPADPDGWANRDAFANGPCQEGLSRVGVSVRPTTQLPVDSHMICTSSGNAGNYAAPRGRCWRASPRVDRSGR
jgi:hypothetical protein